MAMTNKKEALQSDRRKRFRRALGARIVGLRQTRSWSQFDLADRLEISRDRLAKWEAGCHVPPADILLDLSDILEVSIDELLKGRKPSAK
jgi:transcriptional regulator with XRE-family HTH domain